jgi:hypothetical protein
MMLKMNKRSTGSLIAVLALATTGLGAGVAQARNGSDDPVGHNRGDDNGGLRIHSASRGHDPIDNDLGDDNDGRGGAAGGGHHDPVDND